VVGLAASHWWSFGWTFGVWVVCLF
jgi:hypothetical protein